MDAPETPLSHADVQAPAEARGLGIAQPRLGTFASLQYRDFRLFWLGTVGFSAAIWADVVVRNWLAWDLTHSGLVLGLVNLARAIPQLFMSLLAGVLLDRVDRKMVLLASLAGMLALSVVMVVLVMTGVIEVWQLYITSALFGACIAFNNPARVSLIPELVPQQELTNAISLTQVAQSSTRVIGPAMAGFLIAWIGVDGAYLMEAAALILVIGATAAAHIPGADLGKRARGLWGELLEGLSYVRAQSTIFTVLMVSLVPMFFAWPVTTLLTIIADSTLDIGAEGYGVLLMAMGIGSLAGGLGMATFSSLPKGLGMLGGALVFSLAVLALGGAHWLALALVVLLVGGMAQAVYRATVNNILLAQTPDAFRGRVMSMMNLEVAIAQIGGLLAGALADIMTVEWALVIMGSASAAFVAVIAVKKPAIRRL